MFGFLPPSSRQTFFTVSAAPRMIHWPVRRLPVNDTRSTAGLSTSGAPTFGPMPSTRFATPVGQTGLVEQPEQL